MPGHSNYTINSPFSLSGSYNRTETWNQALEKLVVWSKDFLTNKLGARGVDKLEWNASGLVNPIGSDEKELRLKFGTVPLDPSETRILTINFTLLMEKPGVVRVWGLSCDSLNRTEDWIDLKLPLINLSRFDSLDEAAQWLKENPRFYNPGWDSLLAKVV